MGKIARIKNDGTLMIKGEVIETQIEGNPIVRFKDNGDMMVNGKFEQGTNVETYLAFDGVDDSITGVSSTNINWGECTWEFKLRLKKDFKLLPTNYYEGLLGVEQNTPSFRLRGRIRGNVGIGLHFLTTGGGEATVSVGRLVPNKWIHVSCVFSGIAGNVKSYTDGLFDESRAFTTPTVNLTLPFTIGSQAAYPKLFGDMKEFRVWNKVLTVEEIQSNLDKTLIGNEDGLVLYLPMNEGIGDTVVDKTGNGSNGLVNGASWNEEIIKSKIYANIFGMKVFAIEEKATFECLYFDGISQAVSIPNTNNRLQPNNQFTWETWFKLDGFTQYNTLMGFSSNNLDFGRMDTVSNFRCHTYDMNSNATFIRPSGFPSVNDGQWHHMAIVWDGVNGKLWGFVDGIQRYYATMTIGSSIRDTLPFTTFTIGGGTHNSRLIKGWMKEVRLWQVARTQEEILSTMDTRLTGSEDGLFVYFPLDEGKGDIIMDLASGFEANINGANW